MADFEFLFRIGNHGTAVHLRPGADHGQNTANRNNFIVHIFHADIIFFPWIFFAVCGNGNGLGIVADRAAAHGKNQVHIMLFCQFAAFVQFLNSRIGHNPSVLYNLFSVCL